MASRAAHIRNNCVMVSPRPPADQAASAPQTTRTQAQSKQPQQAAQAASAHSAPSDAVAVRLVLILGLLSAIGPFAIDMYLPALPQIGASLNAPVAAVQASLTAFFLALGVGQPVFGTLSDLWGRKKPMYLGLGLFVLASIGCALAQDIHTLVMLRF